jgi:hypothetical protein
LFSKSSEKKSINEQKVKVKNNAFKLEEIKEIYLLVDILLEYYSENPDALLLEDLYELFEEVSLIHSKEKRVKLIKELIIFNTPVNCAHLKHLLQLLHKYQIYQDTIDYKSLGKRILPILFKGYKYNDEKAIGILKMFMNDYLDIYHDIFVYDDEIITKDMDDLEVYETNLSKEIISKFLIINFNSHVK